MEHIHKNPNKMAKWNSFSDDSDSQLTKLK